MLSVGSCIGVLWAETRPDLPPEIKSKVTLDTADEILWWAVVTCSTVGYGDAAPVTSAGRIFAVGLMLVGIGAFGTVTSTLGKRWWMPSCHNLCCGLSEPHTNKVAHTNL